MKIITATLLLLLCTPAGAQRAVAPRDGTVVHFEYPPTVWTKIMVLENEKFMLCRPAIPADSVKTDVVCFSLPRGALVLIPKVGYKLAPSIHKAHDD